MWATYRATAHHAAMPARQHPLAPQHLEMIDQLFAGTQLLPFVDCAPRRTSGRVHAYC